MRNTDPCKWSQCQEVICRVQWQHSSNFINNRSPCITASPHGHEKELGDQQNQQTFQPPAFDAAEWAACIPQGLFHPHWMRWSLETGRCLPLVKVVLTPDRAILMGRTGIAFLGAHQPWWNRQCFSDLGVLEYDLCFRFLWWATGPPTSLDFFYLQHFVVPSFFGGDEHPYPLVK